MSSSAQLDAESSADDVLAAVGKMIARMVRSGELERGDVVPALHKLTEYASEALGVERASVWRFTDNGTRLECVDLFERGASRHSKGMVLLAEATPRYFQALDQERTIAAHDARRDPRTSEFEAIYLAPNGIAAMLDSPIWMSGRLVGVVCHEHTGAPRTWAPWEELVSGTFADLAAMVFGAAEQARQGQLLADYGSKLEQLVIDRTRRLTEEQEFLQNVFATVPFGMAFFDRDGRYVRINEWLCRLNGKTVEETVGKRPSEVLRDPEIARFAELMIQQVLATGHADPVEATANHTTPPSTYLIRMYPIATEAGAARVGCSVIEITAQREGERERALLLERERMARQDAERASRAKDEFLAMLGHELRNPLAPIRTALELMEQLGEVALEERAVIVRQVEHLNRLVDDLLDVARITQGKIELRPRAVQLAAVVAEGIEMASPLIERRKQFLEVEVPEDGLLIHGDLDRLAQVVSNLLTNAAKFTPPGGHIRVKGQHSKSHVELTVRDTGPGIPASLLPQLFEAFVQGERKLDRSQGGLGLGLAIVRGIVGAHGGVVTAHSEGQGHGSEFVVRIPALAATRPRFEEDRATPPRGQAMSNRRRILVVDDNEDAARMLARLLRHNLGHETETAFDGPNAVAIAREFRPQAALLDLGLPVMDGFELAARLRELPGLGDIKLVAVTGYGRPRDLERTKQAGFDDHVVKPIAVMRIEAVLAALFSD